MNLLTRLRIWQCQRSGFGGITPLNNVAEWDNASPDTLAFHWWLKRPLRLAARAIRVPDTWIARLEGNAAALWDIIDRVYLQNEKQAWRRAILEPIAKFAVCLLSFDNNYGEVGDAVLAGIIREREKFVFNPSQINPDNWYQDGRGRVELNTSAPYRVLSRTDAEIVLDTRLDGARVLETHEPGTGRTQYLAIGIPTEPYPGIVAYPILAQGAGVLDVAPAVLGAA